MQEIEFLEFMGGSNVPQAFPNYLICLRFIRISMVYMGFRGHRTMFWSQTQKFNYILVCTSPLNVEWGIMKGVQPLQHLDLMRFIDHSNAPKLAFGTLENNHIDGVFDVALYKFSGGPA